MDTGTATIKQIAEALSITRQSADEKAKKENWPHVVINRRGDRRFYIAQLPEKIRVALLDNCDADQAEELPCELLQDDAASSFFYVHIRLKLWKLDVEWTAKL